MSIKSRMLGCLYWLFDSHPRVGGLVLGILAKTRPNWSDKLVVTIRWMDEAVTLQSGVLIEAVEAPVYAPCFLGQISQQSKVNFGELSYRRFQDATVTARGSNVFLEGTREVIIERVLGVNPELVSYKSGQVIWQGRRNALVSTDANGGKIQKGIFLGGNGSWNYYHWLIEILPKIQLVSALPSVFKKYPLLVSEDLRKIPSFQTTLNRVAPDHELIYLHADQGYCVNDLIWLDAPNNLPFNMRGKHLFQANHCRIRPDSIAWLRRSFIPTKMIKGTHLKGVSF